MSQRTKATGVRKRSPIEIAKCIFFVLFILDILVLYVIYLYNVKDKPSFSHMQEMPPILTGFLVSTGLFLLTYLVWFAITVIMSVVYFCQLTKRSKIMFLMSIAMLMICIATLLVGVYSPFYSNGQIFIFFQAFFNLYVWTLIYLNWPTEVNEMIHLREEIEMEIRFSRSSQ